MTTQFQVGQEYKITGYNDTIKVVKRTDKSVWFEYEGETLRKKIHNVSSGEKIVLDGGSACVFPESVIEPQVSVNEVETIEPQANKDVEYAEIISLDELDLIHLIQDLTLIELENANRKKLETLEFPQDEILETLEFPQDEILETLEFPQGSTHELDLFEVVYQVLDCDDEVSYESRTVYANSKNHAKSIVIQSLQAQHLRFCITGCDYALVIDDLSDFAMAGYDEF